MMFLSCRMVWSANPLLVMISTGLTTSGLTWNPFIKFKMMATENFNFENSIFFGIDLVYPFHIEY